MSDLIANVAGFFIEFGIKTKIVAFFLQDLDSCFTSGKALSGDSKKIRGRSDEIRISGCLFVFCGCWSCIDISDPNPIIAGEDEVVIAVVE